MCDVWIIESSKTYSSLEHELLKENLSGEIDLDICELHPREAFIKMELEEYPNIVILDTIVPSTKTKNIIDQLKIKNPETKCMIVSSDRRGFEIEAKKKNMALIEKPFLPSVFIALFKEVYNSSLM